MGWAIRLQELYLGGVAAGLARGAAGAGAGGDALVQLLAQAALQARAAAVGLAAALPALPPPVVVQVQPRSAAPAQDLTSKSCVSLRLPFASPLHTLSL